MATTGTFNFATSQNVAEIVEEAFRRIQRRPELITADMAMSARFSLNYLFLEMVNRGRGQFIIEQETQVLAAEDRVFTMPEGSVDILNMVIRIDNTDVPMIPQTRKQYLQIPTKDVPGQPTEYFVDKSTYPPTIYVWPMPNTEVTLIYDRLKMIEDAGNPTNTLAVFPLWLDAICYALAERLAEKYNKSVQADMLVKKQESYTLAKQRDRDLTPVRNRPIMGGLRWSRRVR